MRKEFFTHLLERMDENPKIYTLFFGLGYPRYDEFKARHPKRSINCEASEQAGLDIAVGLALEGMIPFTYTITPFYWRGAETIRTYISHENLPVIMCGAGRDEDYTVDDGFSHDAKDIGMLMMAMKINCYYPEDVRQMKMIVDHVIDSPARSFISLRR